MNMDTQISLQLPPFTSFGHIPRRWLAGSCVSSFLTTAECPIVWINNKLIEPVPYCWPGRQLLLFINIRVTNILVNISLPHSEFFIFLNMDWSILLRWLKTPRAPPNSQAQRVRPSCSGLSCHCSPSLTNHSLWQCSRTCRTPTVQHSFPLPVFVHVLSSPWNTWPSLCPLELESLPKCSPWLNPSLRTSPPHSRQN